MELIIYETTHFENLPALLELSRRYFNKTTVFLTEQSYQQILPLFNNTGFPIGLHFKIQTKEITNRGFIKLFFKNISLNTYTHLHINTLEHNMLFFAIRLLKVQNIKISMTVHLINEYRTFSFQNFKKITESFAKLILHKKIDNYRVLAPAMEPYFFTCFPNKKVVFIPGNFYDLHSLQNTNKNSNYFTVAIPGTVEAKRRDYALVIRLFKANISTFTKYSKIKVILLGNANSDFGKEIIAQFKKLINADFVFEWFDEEVDQENYNNIFCEADIVWNPIIVHTKGIRNVAETSSISISPGFITDQMHFGKPAIIPQAIQVHKVLKACNFYYKDEADIKKVFIQILSNPDILKQKNQQTKEACKYFNVHNYESAFKVLVNENL